MSMVTMATSQGNSKVASSNWKNQYYFSLILIKGRNIYVTCSYAQEKRLYPHPPQVTRILWSISHQHMLTWRLLLLLLTQPQTQIYKYSVLFIVKNCLKYSYRDLHLMARFSFVSFYPSLDVFLNFALKFYFSISIFSIFLFLCISYGRLQSIEFQ